MEETTETLVCVVAADLSLGLFSWWEACTGLGCAKDTLWEEEGEGEERGGEEGWLETVVGFLSWLSAKRVREWDREVANDDVNNDNVESTPEVNIPMQNERGVRWVCRRCKKRKNNVYHPVSFFCN